MTKPYIRPITLLLSVEGVEALIEVLENKKDCCRHAELPDIEEFILNSLKHELDVRSKE